jgi:hypothetical protein
MSDDRTLTRIQFLDAIALTGVRAQGNGFDVAAVAPLGWSFSVTPRLLVARKEREVVEIPRDRCVLTWTEAKADPIATYVTAVAEAQAGHPQSNAVASIDDNLLRVPAPGEPARLFQRIHVEAPPASVAAAPTPRRRNLPPGAKPDVVPPPSQIGVEEDTGAPVRSSVLHVEAS